MNAFQLEEKSFENQRGTLPGQVYTGKELWLQAKGNIQSNFSKKNMHLLIIPPGFGNRAEPGPEALAPLLL